MANDQWTPGVVSGRLPADQLAENFGDLHPLMDAHEALVAADPLLFLL